MSNSTLPKSVQAQMNSSNSEGSTSSQDRAKHRREFVENIKNLPDDFLRIPFSSFPQEAVPHPMAIMEAPLIDMIEISVVEAQLVKNYGLMRMDLYCKIRVGHMVCETSTCLNGARNPKWDGVYQFSLKPGIEHFHLEIYDERQFSLDTKIAWLYEPIPREIFMGMSVERWFPLSGQLGQNKEGSVLLVISHKRVPMRASNFGRAAITRNHPQGPPLTMFVPVPEQTPVMGGPVMIPGDPQVTSQSRHRQNFTLESPQEQPLPTRPASEQDINQLKEMFPSHDMGVIKAMLEKYNHDKEAAIVALLSLPR